MRYIKTIFNTQFLNGVIMGVVLVCGFAMIIAIPYEFESASIISKVHFGLGIVEGILVVSYGRLFGAIIKDYMENIKHK